MQRGLGGFPQERLHQEHYQKTTFARGLLKLHNNKAEGRRQKRCIPIPDSRLPTPDSRLPLL
ncbi:MAG: hypothetical protein F6K65_27440 [Moorea sp. SIO3C2]|nr:hypothetical protein [Moorena sp. SIO3C2]